MPTQDVIVPECAASGSYDPVLETIKIDAAARAHFRAAMRRCRYPYGDSRRVAFAEGALVAACFGCNVGKGARTPDEWRAARELRA